MQKQNGRPLFSAGDVVSFLECAHAATLALQDLERPLPRAEDHDSLELIQQKGFAHEAEFLSSIKKKGLRVAELPSDGFQHALTLETEASPALMHIDCLTPEQMKLANLLCWITSYADQR